MSTHDTEKPLTSNGWTPSPADDNAAGAQSHKAKAEASRAVLAGLLGGVASAVGYIIYSRLPPEQKDKLHTQVRGYAQGRIDEIRSSFDI